ncbi:MAG: prepilin peptidase [Dokdonella sp.]|uniref:prepilin peptidase n=1 Tax=Dokdonella sp. TaxID=2291710 RepID=UPI0025C098DC|nr:A24 family peptidase [Dokdonella sp.]MBX3701711.1 prepilin peptidase [Dokdonella sp.]MCW5579586.1 prepilin peptidase [Dokdonella sp.]
MDWLQQPAPLIALSAVLGLLVGSFLNVVILRLPRRLEHEWRQQAHDLLHEGTTAAAPEGAAAAVAGPAPPDLVFTASHCPHCKHPLSPFDNIPLLSWLALRGRCRYCRAPISWQYPLVELLTALASATLAWKFGYGWQLAAGLLLTWTLIAASGIDVRTQLLPDQLTLPLLWLGLLIALVPVYVDPATAIIGAAAGYLSLWSVYWLFRLTTGKEGMGYGDFKLLGALGAWMGASSLLPIVLLSSLIGAIIGGIALALQGRDRSTPIPFGPFIAAAGWAWFVFGDRLGALYARLFGLA